MIYEAKTYALKTYLPMDKSEIYFSHENYTYTLISTCKMVPFFTEKQGITFVE